MLKSSNRTRNCSHFSVFSNQTYLQISDYSHKSMSSCTTSLSSEDDCSVLSVSDCQQYYSRRLQRLTQLKQTPTQQTTQNDTQNVFTQLRQDMVSLDSFDWYSYPGFRNPLFCISLQYFSPIFFFSCNLDKLVEERKSVWMTVMRLSKKGSQVFVWVMQKWHCASQI